MVDFHSHILPNLDDGARSIEEAFSLIKEAEKAGFNEIIFTPHYKEGYYETDVREREIWLNTLSKKFENIYNIKTYLASEIYLTKNIIKLLEDEKASTINNTSYVLFELPKQEEPLEIYDCIHEMQKNKVVPILAHPERYIYVQKEPDILYELVQKGVYIQGNYGSILGVYGKKAQIIMKKMLENNLVHFLGTDVHREKTIYSEIPYILEEIENIIGKEKLYELTTKNPQLALNNKKINMRDPIEIKLEPKEKIKMFLSR